MIYILLSTYNGSEFLSEFLASLEMQSYQNWRLLVRDDGSKDTTLSILEKFVNKVKKVEVIPDRTNIGAKASFARLLEVSLEDQSWDYLMFADQDDVWINDKIEKTLLTMKDLNGDRPLLVHSDVSVVDSNLKMINHSFWRYQNIDPKKDAFNNLLLQNIVTGCTIMMNRKLAQMVLPIPNEAIMHDWWIAMVASAFGKIAHVDEPLMLYRQHSSNDTGAKRYGFEYFMKKLFEKPSFEKYIQQSQAFLSLYGNELNVNQRKMLEEFSALNRLTKWKKLQILFKYKIWKNGFMRNLGLVFFV